MSAFKIPRAALLGSYIAEADVVPEPTVVKGVLSGTTLLTEIPALRTRHQENKRVAVQFPG